MTDDTREEAELVVLFRSLDNDPRRVGVDEVIARAEARRTAPWRIAAGIAVPLAVSGAAWAMPGSPVPGWVRSVLETERDPAPAAGRPGGAVREATPGGLAFEPGEALVVAIEAGSVGVLRVGGTSDPRIVVQAVSGEARFTSLPNRLEVVFSRPDTLDVRIPDTAVNVVVTVEGRAVFSKTGDAVDTTLPRDTEGRWVREVGGAP